LPHLRRRAAEGDGNPFLILEKNENVGGTWCENEYPGCAVDTPTISFHTPSSEPQLDAAFLAP